MKKRNWPLRLLLIVLVVLVVAGAGFYVWASTPLAPMPEALSALETTADVIVSVGDLIVFEPADGLPETGFIFYPGGRVDARAYAPLMQQIAEKGYLAIIAPMPLNLAILGIERADAARTAHPMITRWVIGGHSLGGSMAVRYAHAHPQEIQGIVLWASYPEASFSLADRDIAAASIYGALDGLATTGQVEGSRPYLPPSAAFVEIAGGNHANFGYYGEQPNDNPSTITREAQQQQTLDATLAVLEQVAAG